MRGWGEISFFYPTLRYNPRFFSITTSAFLLSVVGIPASRLAGVEFFDAPPELYSKIFDTLYFGLIYLGMAKIYFDFLRGIKPSGKRLREDKDLHFILDCLGKVDEVMSFYEYGRSMDGRVSLPQVEIAPAHYFEARGLINPIIAKNNLDYVANDVYLDDCKLSFVTGPNSGGKTTLVKTIEQAQIMAQIGCYVPAYFARVAMADRIFYQYYQPDKLQHPEGDFGVNLERTKDIFFASTPRSLVILNVLASGTTPHEGDEQAISILNDFFAVGNNTVYVTHNHPVAEEYQRRGIGQFLKTHFVDGNPTYKFVPGISIESHAAKIAEKIGFSPEDRRRHLIEKGYLKP